MGYFVCVLFGFVLGSAAAACVLFFLVERRSQRSVIERRLRTFDDYTDCLGDLEPVLSADDLDELAFRQARENLRAFCREFHATRWSLSEEERGALASAVARLEDATRSALPAAPVQDGRLSASIENGRRAGAEHLLADYRSVRRIVGELAAKERSALRRFRYSPPPAASSPRSGSAVAGAVVCCALAARLAPLSAQLAPQELEARRAALEKWTFEPVALEKSGYALHLDRRDGSFFLRVQRSGVKHFSPTHRRGFASVVLADGRVLPVDRVEALDSRDDRIRFRAASSGGELPPLWLEWRDLGQLSGVSLRFEVAAERHGEVRAVRLLDRALWVSDADGGGAAVPRGLGEWIDPAGEPLVIHLRGFLDAGRPPEESYTLAGLGLMRGEGPLVLAWDDARTAITLTRGRAEDDRFPGESGLFVSAEVPGGRGEIRLIAPTDVQFGRYEIPRALRGLIDLDKPVATLRSKTGKREELRTLFGAAIAPLEMAAATGPGSTRAAARLRFSDAAGIAEHWKRALEIDEALLLFEDWCGSANAAGGRPWTAREECGGDAELAAASKRIHEAGYLVGLSISLARLSDTGTAAGASSGIAAAWSTALRRAREDEGFESIARRFSPDLLVIEDDRGSDARGSDDRGSDARGSDDRGAKDPAASRVELSAARDAVARHAADVFGLYARRPGTADDVRSAGLIEGLFDAKLLAPTSRQVFPFFLASFADAVRLPVSAAHALGPDDAAGFLAHLVFAQAPVYEVEPQPGTAASGAAVADDPRWCFAREGGWTAGRGLSPRDVYIKNTYEVASWLARLAGRERFASQRFVTADGMVQEAQFGFDLRVLVNFGATEHEDEESDTVLPQYGFLVRHPYLLAFHAVKAGGLAYDKPAFYVVRSLEGKMYLRAERVRIYRGFGPSQVRIGGRTFEVDRELVTKIW